MHHLSTRFDQRDLISSSIIKMRGKKVTNSRVKIDQSVLQKKKVVQTRVSESLWSSRIQLSFTTVTSVCSNIFGLLLNSLVA